MAMNTDAISRLEAIIGSAKEVETNEDGELIGEIARVVTMFECLNHNKPKDRWNRSNTTRMEETGQQEDQENQNQSQMQPNSTPETG
ncbi:hypothetical protein WN944_022555 [Citrus x changshan-huyou]|uniref:Uncharacterized protein n=1 Tax=Citrus x changshan-huyou TaxID=2935761 RepID=A0AAP0MYP8_9ROSI